MTQGNPVLRSFAEPLDRAADPDGVPLVDRARAMSPRIAAARVATDMRRDVSEEIIGEMRSARLLRSFQPARWGGLELDPRTVFEIQNVFAEVCPSTAWVYAVLSVQAFMLARFDPQAQADVWSADPDAVMSSSFQPVGQVTPVDGGFRISGRFGYSSGSSHASWVLVGGLVPPAEGQAAPEMRLFLLPRADYEIDGVWNPIGLRGTGSHDIVIDDAFVPAHRTYRPDAGLLPLPASTGLAQLYRLPWLYVFTSTISNLGTGTARGAVNAFVDAMRVRNRKQGKPVASDSARLALVARSLAEIDASESLAKRNFGRLIDSIAEDRVIELEEALLYRAQLTSSMRQMAGLVDQLMQLSGSAGIRADAPLTRFWLDMMAARTHVGNDPEATYGQLGTEFVARTS